MATENLSYRIGPQLPVLDGSTMFNPGLAGVTAYSTLLRTGMIWKNSKWQVVAVPSTINKIEEGDIQTIPSTYNLIAYTDLVIDGELVLDGVLIEV